MQKRPFVQFLPKAGCYKSLNSCTCAAAVITQQVIAKENPALSNIHKNEQGQEAAGCVSF